MGALIAALGLAAALLAPAASAAAPPFLLRAPEDTLPGSGASQIGNPRSIATDPNTGHVFVSDSLNNRIDEFTPWGLFVKAWGWGVADGAPEPQTCGPAEPEVAPSTSLCQSGINGPGEGQMEHLYGIAVDSAGDVYVFEGKGPGAEPRNMRVQKFDSDGNFLLMIGGEVNKTKSEEGTSTEAERNVCTAASGDECQAGTLGTGDGQFSEKAGGNNLAIGPGGALYVGDGERIQVFEPDGAYREDFPDPEGVIAGVNGEEVESVGVDSAGDVWVSGLRYTIRGEAEVVKLDPAGHEVCAIEGLEPPLNDVSVDAADNVYVVVGTDDGKVENEAVEYGPGCEPLLPPGSRAITTPSDHDIYTQLASPAIATGVSCPGGGEAGDVYMVNFTYGVAAYFDAYGPPPSCFEGPPEVPPRIDAQFATAVSAGAATVEAQVNPRFFDDTRYYVEYGTGKCSEGGCAKTEPAPPGALLTSSVVNQTLTSGAVALSGLAAGTTYHYRFVAESGGGGPVYGIDPDGKEGPEEASFGAGLEATFTTRSPRPQPNAGCPNQAYRAGAGAYLPDCRAYELVTPVDKGNGDILVLSARDGYPVGMEQATPGGGGIAYATYRAFGESASSPYASEYLARRGTGGWASAGINPPREGLSYLTGNQFALPFKGFSEDLGEAWLQQDTAPVLEPGAPGGFTNLYRRANATGSYGALIPTAPANLGSWVFEPEVQGFSADGSCTVFRANDRLTTAAPAAPNLGDVYQLYESCEGQPLRLVSALLGGTPNSTYSTAGTVNSTGFPDRESSVAGAVSEDGQSVYWTATTGSTGPGTLYLRTNASQPQSSFSAGHCTEAATKACTVLVSSGPAQFLQGSPGGGSALYEKGGALFRYDADTEASTELIGQSKGLLGASENLDRVYAVSEEAFDGGQAGKPNLYLIEGTAKTLVATLAAADISGTISPASMRPSRRPTRVSPAGGNVAFLSRAPLTGYDNTDQKTGEADAELFLYDAVADSLACVSCNPTGQRPTGRPLKVNGLTALRAAAAIPAWKTQLYAPRALSADGSRLFFESFESLLPADTNGKADVYEWERASSAGACNSAGAGAYLPAAGGCLSLISSGESSEDSEFVDASSDGSDVFIRTGQSLLSQDPGLIDIYDARVGGGFSPPAAPPAECVGQACQNPAAAPRFPGMASESFSGYGNVKQSSKPKRCPKGKHRKKHKGKVRCVKNKLHSHRARHRRHKRSKRGRSRRAGR